MRLKTAINLGSDCGLSTIRECILNVEIHSTSIFEYSKIDEELMELNTDIEKISIQYDASEEEVLNWTIKEYLLYV